MPGFKNQLIFDSTDADTLAASDHVGSYVLSDDGTQITHHTVGSDEGLDVYLLNASVVVTATDLDIRDLTQTDEITVYQGTSPWVIGDGGGSITVDAVDLDIRDLSHTTDSISIGDGTDLLAINADGSLNITDNGGSITVDATDLDIRDLSQAQDSVQSWLYDAAGNGLTSTLVGADQALDVNIVSGVNVEVDLSHTDDSVALGDGTNLLTSTTVGGDIGLDVYQINDPTLANSSIVATAETLDVADTAQDVVASPLANRKYLWIHNFENKGMYIGGTGVTASNGFPVGAGVSIELRAGAAVDIEYVSSQVNHEIRTLELS